MQELKFTLKVYHKHPKGYGIMPHVDNHARLAWKKMTEEIKPPLRYIEHFIDEDWQDLSDEYGTYISDKQSITDLNIPLGNLKIILVVYVDGEPCGD